MSTTTMLATSSLDINPVGTGPRGEKSGGGGGKAAAGVIVTLLSVVGGVLIWRRRQQQRGGGGGARAGTLYENLQFDRTLRFEDGSDDDEEEV